MNVFNKLSLISLVFTHFAMGSVAQATQEMSACEVKMVKSVLAAYGVQARQLQGAPQVTYLNESLPVRFTQGEIMEEPHVNYRVSAKATTKHPITGESRLEILSGVVRINSDDECRVMGLYF